MKRSMSKRTQGIAVTTLSNQREIEHRKDIVKLKRLYRSLSCPCLSTTKQPICVHSTPSDIGCNKVKLHFRRQRFVPKMLINFIQRRAASTAPNMFQNLGNVCAGPCPCPCEPCGCNCLPPPCNTPAKCLQNMSGYYYYPYGTWFCGPYHVSTGGCRSCAGPVRPGGPCGPTPPCPGGPSGPACIGPCSPCGACTPCGPLSCCGICSVGSPFSCNAAGSPYGYSSTFNSMGTYGPHTQFTPNQYMQQHCYTPFNPYANYNQFGQFNTMPASHFGPCCDMPIATPIPVYNAFAPMQGTFGPDPYIPSPPPPSPISNPGSFTYSKPTITDISSSEVMRTSPSINGACPKNLSPKPLRTSPTSRYETCMNLSKSGRSPKVFSRVLPQPNSTSVCYFSTKSMQKQSTNNIDTVDNNKEVNGSNTYQMLHDTKCQDSCNKLLCYWCILSGRYARNKGIKRNIVAAQKKLDST